MAAIAGRSLVTIILALTTLTSASVAAAYSINYYQFYPALQQLEMSNPTMSFSPTNSSLNAYAIFTLVNPTSYTGLTLAEFEPTVDVYGPGGGYIPAGNFIEFIPPRASLDPGKAISENVSFSGSGSGVLEIYNMVHPSSGQPIPLSDFNFNFTIGVTLNTFLQTFTAIRLVYTCYTHFGGGVACSEIAVLLNSTPTPSAGGGGGLYNGLTENELVHPIRDTPRHHHSPTLGRRTNSSLPPSHLPARTAKPRR